MIGAVVAGDTYPFYVVWDDGKSSPCHNRDEVDNHIRVAREWRVKHQPRGVIRVTGLKKAPPILPVREAEGFRILWKVGDAIVMWLSHPERINGSFTCEEIAEGIYAERAVYAFEHWSGKLSPQQINAAISGLSIRARGPQALTDIPAHASVHTKHEDGLRVPWRKRQWRLTVQGIQRARLLSDVRNRYVDNAEERRRERA